LAIVGTSRGSSRRRSIYRVWCCIGGVPNEEQQH
jgi:hypothetical protein